MWDYCKGKLRKWFYVCVYIYDIINSLISSAEILK